MAGNRSAWPSTDRLLSLFDGEEETWWQCLKLNLYWKHLSLIIFVYPCRIRSPSKKREKCGLFISRSMVLHTTITGLPRNLSMKCLSVLRLLKRISIILTGRNIGLLKVENFITMPSPENRVGTCRHRWRSGSLKWSSKSDLNENKGDPTPKSKN